MDYQPKQKTHLIKILSGNPDADIFFKQLNNRLYVPFAYTFADIDVPKHAKILFDETIAEKIIQDFQNSTDCLELLVVCLRGQNRSPAVAMALNEIFNLDEDTEQLKQKYSYFTQRIYRIMNETAKK